MRKEWSNVAISDDSAIMDAGSRVRVSQINTLIDVKQINDNQPLFIDRENIGGGTQSYVKAKGGVEMAVTTTADAAIAQTKQFAPYFSGKGHLSEFTFSNMQPEDNVVKRVGFFSTNTTTPFDSNRDGIYLESASGTSRIVIEKDGTEIASLDKTAWGGPLKNIDLEKFNVMIIQFLYLGGTAIRIGFFYQGGFMWAFVHDHAGNFASTFVLSPSQPLRYEIRSTGGAGRLDQVCMQASTEGSIDEIGVSRSFYNQDLQADSAGTVYAAQGLRLKSGYRNIRVDKQGIALLCETNDNAQWYLLLNPTIAGTFTYNDVANSSLQYAQGATANTISDLGVVLDTGFIVASSAISKEFKNSLRIGTKIDGTQDTLVLAVEPLSINLDIWTSFTLNEFI
jgi:hypothetical protein